MNSRFARVVLAFCLLLPPLAHAHAGVGAISGFASGLAHPISGLDHLLAMLAIGIWAAQMGRRSIWAVPLAFVSVMALGGMLVVLGGAVSFAEPGIAVSVLALGILIVAAARLPLAASIVVAGLFAVFHGYAHGTGMPLGASGTAYGIGFILSTASLHLCGIGSGVLMQRVSVPWIVRAAGAPIALFGGYLCLAG